MKTVIATAAMAVATLLMSTALSTDALAAKGGTPGRPGGGETTAGNNLSFPVLWAEGVTKRCAGLSVRLLSMAPGGGGGGERMITTIP